MPVAFMQRRAKSPSGPRPTDDAINNFVDFFEAPDLSTAQESFLQRLVKAFFENTEVWKPCKNGLKM
jgi:hypothetical protein